MGTSSQSSPELLSLADAATGLPSRPHASTLWRWAKRGIKGIHLRLEIVGGRYFVAPEALSDFLGKVSVARRIDVPRNGRPKLEIGFPRRGCSLRKNAAADRQPSKSAEIKNQRPGR